MELFTVRLEHTSKKGYTEVKYITSKRKDYPKFKFSKDISRINFEFIYNTKEKAETKAKEIKNTLLDIYTEALRLYKDQESINKRHNYFPRYITSRCGKVNYDNTKHLPYSSINNLKKISESDVVVCPYEITGKFNKGRITNNEWVASGSPNKFCNICGCNILTHKFFSIGSIYKICPVCIKKASIVADKEISVASEHWGIDIFEENEVQRFVGRL